MKKLLLVLSMACLPACSTVGHTVTVIGGAVYTTASKAVDDYCALTPQQRMLTQLIVAGKAYNSGLCDVVNGDVTLQAKVDAATQDAAAKLLGDAVTKAVSDGKITQAQADVILGVPDGSS